MDTPLDLTGYAHALGSAQAGWRFAGPHLRRASALAAVSAAWDIFCRDAGVGDVGPAHETTPAAAGLLFTDDPRRDPMVLWLADHGAPSIAEAAVTIVRMVRPTQRFGAEERTLLDVARNALAYPATKLGPIGRVVAAAGRSDDTVLEPLNFLANAVDRLRGDPGFLEGEGAEVRHVLPGGRLIRHSPPEPAGCWALNLALMAKGAKLTAFSPPGSVSRASFRSNLEPEELAGYLLENASAAWREAYGRLSRLEQQLVRGRDALAHFSRNARTRDAWLLVAALGGCTRPQLARALGLSRAGADIQAHALADAELVTLAAGGRIAWERVQTKKDVSPTRIQIDPLSGAVSDLDASMAEIDRLLARNAD